MLAPVLELGGGMIAIAAAWTGYIMVLVGLGLLLHRIVTPARLRYGDLATSFWAGLAVAVLVLQISHFFIPISWLARTVLVVFSGTGYALHRDSISRLLRHRPGFNSTVLLLVGLAVVVIAYRATAEPLLYDTGLYHTGVAQWSNSYPIVPGLGNLHDRLAFNNSSLLLAAALNIGPWRTEPTQLLSGLLVLALLVTLVTRLRPGQAPGSGGGGDVFHAVLLAPTVLLILKPGGQQLVATLSPDLAASVVALAAVTLAYESLAGRLPASARGYQLATAATLLALGICFKVSTLIFGGVGWIGLVGLYLRRERAAADVRALAFTFGLAGLLLATWALRGVILTGYPLYPSALFPAPVDWLVPVERANAHVAWIGHYARGFYDYFLYNFAPYEPRTPGNWAWLGGWLGGVLNDYQGRWFLAVPLSLAALDLTRAFVRRAGRTVAAPVRATAPIGAAAAASILFWFFTAPAPRFALYPFWILAAIAATIRGNEPPSNRAFREPLAAAARMAGLVAALVVLEGAVALVARPGRPTVTEVTRTLLLVGPEPEPWEGSATAAFGTYQAESGLILTVPLTDNRCWTAPLPCTPYPAPNLRLRHAGDLGGGFAVDGDWIAEGWPNPNSLFKRYWDERDH